MSKKPDAGMSLGTNAGCEAPGSEEVEGLLDDALLAGASGGASDLDGIQWDTLPELGPDRRCPICGYRVVVGGVRHVSMNTERGILWECARIGASGVFIERTC